VDTEHHLIVAHEVTNLGIDKDHLSPMAEQARDALEAEKIEVVADKGYFNSDEIAACEDAGIDVYVPKPATSNARARGRFDKDDFIYDRQNDRYVCPAGQKLTRRMTCEENGHVLHVYWTNTCGDCPLKSDCTTGKERRVRRWEREDVLERAQARLDGNPGAMQLRRETVEHPFGTIKAWMGATHFKMKTLEHVGTEMALHVLAYNVKRVIAILGVPGLIEAMLASAWGLRRGRRGHSMRVEGKNSAQATSNRVCTLIALAGSRSHTVSYKCGHDVRRCEPLQRS
jgi:Transposase DDE domain